MVWKLKLRRDIRIITSLSGEGRHSCAALDLRVVRTRGIGPRCWCFDIPPRP